MEGKRGTVKWGEETDAKGGLSEEKHTLLCKSPIVYSKIYKFLSIFYPPRLSHVILKFQISRKSPLLLLLHIRRVSMESGFLRSLNCITSPLRSITEKPGVFPMHGASFSSFAKHTVQGLAYGGKLISSPSKLGGVIVSCAKSSEATSTAKSVGDANGAVEPDSFQKVSGQNNSIRRAIFPNGFEALVTDVCDDTEIAELKVKVGDFEMHLKRHIEPPKPPAPVESPTVAPPIPGKPMNESAFAAGSPPPSKSAAEKVSPFINIPAERSAKIAALEASGSSGYVLLPSPMVGLFRRGRTVKGNKQPPIVKEGDLITEGQTVGFLDQFGTEFAVKSNADGEILKFLYNDGEAVGYGDPLIAILPSFHSIE